ncbi:hypothetical protein BDFB_008673, partial [Asbolus verrucosus]
MVVFMLNAIFKIIEPTIRPTYFGFYDDIMSDKSDFCSISHFYMSHLFEDVEFSYPHEKKPSGCYNPNKCNISKRTVFQSFLTSPYVKPNSLEKINTTAALRGSDLKIYSSGPLAKMTPSKHGLCEKIFVIFVNTVLKLLANENDPPFYIMDESLTIIYH